MLGKEGSGSKAWVMREFSDCAVWHGKGKGRIDKKAKKDYDLSRRQQWASKTKSFDKH